MDELDPKDIEEEMDEDLDVDDILVPGKKKLPKKDDDETSLDELADEEDAILPEDEFDDKDLW